MRFFAAVSAIALLSCGCTGPSDPPVLTRSETEKPKAIEAQLIASDGSWGNTEGPAIDSKGNLYFTSRGTYKGIIRWNAKEGASRYLDAAVKAGPGGLWFDDDDNLYITATDEREVQLATPARKLSSLAKGFEKDPKTAKGPNDLVRSKNGTIYFTDPNGYDGSAPNGTVYRIAPDGRTSVFSEEVTGPNGIILSLDQRTLYVSHNINADTSKIVFWPLEANGAAGAMKELVTVPNCVADGMDIDREVALWLTCYSFGTAYRITPQGKITHVVTTGQKALTNAKFGRAGEQDVLYLTSSDMERVTGYIYRAKVPVGGVR
jgi:gluconolactonase